MRITINELRRTIRKVIVEAKMTSEEIAKLGEMLVSLPPDEDTVRQAIELGESLRLIRVIEDRKDGNIVTLRIKPKYKLKKWVRANYPKEGLLGRGQIYIHANGNISYQWIHERPPGYWEKLQADPHQQGSLRN